VVSVKIYSCLELSELVDFYSCLGKLYYDFFYSLKQLNLNLFVFNFCLECRLEDKVNDLKLWSRFRGAGKNNLISLHRCVGYSNLLPIII
jgi:hypothetical protein